MNHNEKVVRLLSTAGLGSALLIGCDGADQDVVLPDGAVVTYAAIDANGDGYVDFDEWNRFHDTWDINGDGVIDSNEWALDAPINQADTSRDGTVDEKEYRNAFSLLDGDKNNLLDSNELILD